MQNFACPKCGSIDVYIKENGTQTGLYCGDCGKWIKWLGKEEKRLVERWIESNKLTTAEVDIDIKSMKPEQFIQHLHSLKSKEEICDIVKQYIICE